ncbi:MAG: DUF2934 domain-containing protein [Leptolyngbyaceae cyanobacterium]
MPKISEDLIRKKAYEIWEARGDNHGSAESDWKQAEKTFLKSYHPFCNF